MGSMGESVCIAVSASGEVFGDRCSLEERNGVWKDLEHYWEDEKQRLQNCDGQNKLSNSWEERLVFNECVTEPKPKQGAPMQTINGKENKDIPTNYTIRGFQPHELIVVGTYVDKRILPGFRYKVRRNLSDAHLFDGAALPLQTIGQGYGKRLTFASDHLNDNPNFFWSDSREDGFGFALQTLTPDRIFHIRDTATDREVGRVVVGDPAVSPDAELTTEVAAGGRIEKTVRVHFRCDVVLGSAGHSQQNVFVADAVVKGRAVVVRHGPSTLAEIERIDMEDFLLENCHLLPE